MFSYMKDRDSVKRTLKIAWPAMLEAFLVSITSIIDTLMVSSLGTEAVAAVSLCTNPMYLVIALFSSINVMVSALTARRKGEDNRYEVNRILTEILFLSIVLGIVLCGAFAAFADEIVTFMGADDNIRSESASYIRIAVGGFGINAVSLAVNASQRGIGNTKITMMTNTASNAVNLLGNYLLINGHFGFPALGVKGAAIATVSGSCVAAMISLSTLAAKNGYLNFSYIIKNRIKPDFSTFKHLIVLSVPVMTEQTLTRIAFIIVTKLVSGLGSTALAIHQVGMNVMGLSFSFGDGLSAACVALIGESLGRNDIPSAKKYVKICRFISGSASVLLAAIYCVMGKWFYGLFFHEEQSVAIGGRIMMYMSFIVLVQLIQVVYMGALRGAGDNKYVAFISVFALLVVRPLCVYFFCYIMKFDISGAWLGIAIDQFLRVLLVVRRYRTEKWTKIKI